MNDSAIKYFSFFFSGEIDKNKEIEVVKFDLLNLLPDSRNIIKKIVFTEELEIGKNLDFEGIVNLIKSFHKSGAGYRIELNNEVSESENAGAEKKISEEAIGFELEIEKSKIVISKIEVKVNNAEKLKWEDDDIRSQMRGKIGQRYILLNTKLNEVWEQRKSAAKKLLNHSKDDLLNQMQTLKAQTEKREFTSSGNETEPDLIKEAYNILEEGDQLLSRINAVAVSAGIVPKTGEQKGCFIASAVYGEESPEVHFFRKWRDTVLKKTLYGRALIRIYYFLSPSISIIIKKRQQLKKTGKLILDKMIKKLRAGVDNY